MVQKYQTRTTTDDFISPNLKISPEDSQRAYLNILEDMQAEQTQMERQRIATFNIMEDITESQEVLRQRYNELDTLKKLIQNLGLSLKTTVVLGNLVSAIRQTFPATTNLAYVIPPIDPGKFSSIMYVHAAEPLSSDYLLEIKKSLELEFDSLPTDFLNKKRMCEWVRGKFLYEFVEGIKQEKGNQQPHSIFNIPLIIGDELFGILNVSSRKSGLFTEAEVELSNTMVKATSNTIARLRQLLDSEQSRIQSLVETSSNGWVLFDVDKRITMANKSAQKMTGLPAKGFYLSELTKLFKGAAAAAAAAADKNTLKVFDHKIIQVLESGQEQHMEEVHISRFTYEVFLNPMLDYEKNIIGGALVLHDITHIKEIDRMKTEFVSVASHQLRTPLTAINWHLEMLIAGDVGVVNDEQKEYLEEVYSGSKRMVRLVNDLLNVSRLETGRLKIEPELVDLVAYLENIIKEVEPLYAARNCEVRFKKPKEALKPVGLDKTLMWQVIHNLLTNALRYSPKGKCAVSLTLAKSDEKEYLISVRDEGLGIPENVQSRIFEKFFRADNAKQVEAEGSGLGLYIAKMIVSASGGKMWFESIQNKGTTFFLTIPMDGMKAVEGEKGLAEHVHEE
jgi:signal transduction histidine kinase